MVLQTSYAVESDIPEKYRELYSPAEDGKWILSGIEGVSVHSGEHPFFAGIGKTPDEILKIVQEHESLKTSLGEANAKISEYGGKLRTGTIHSALRAAAAEKGIRPEAVSDVLARAGEFDLDESGRVTGTWNGQHVSPAEWLDRQLERSPHWLTPSRSGGVRSFTSGTAARRTPSTMSEIIHQSWNQNQQTRKSE